MRRRCHPVAVAQVRDGQHRRADQPAGEAVQPDVGVVRARRVHGLGQRGRPQQQPAVAVLAPQVPHPPQHRPRPQRHAPSMFLKFMLICKKNCRPGKKVVKIWNF